MGEAPPLGGARTCHIVVDPRRRPAINNGHTATKDDQPWMVEQEAPNREHREEVYDAKRNEDHPDLLDRVLRRSWTCHHQYDGGELGH